MISYSESQMKFILIFKFTISVYYGICVSETQLKFVILLTVKRLVNFTSERKLLRGIKFPA